MPIVTYTTGMAWHSVHSAQYTVHRPRPQDTSNDDGTIPFRTCHVRRGCKHSQGYHIGGCAYIHVLYRKMNDPGIKPGLNEVPEFP